ncbi:MAG TPA: SPFH domain-containing protein [Thermomicrobiales bacterium]|nr:SPFH domain-containing protein [Thermomicrobiales bacterium]
MAIIDLIEHPNEASNELVYRVPEGGSGEFRLGSQLVVRESQRAVFFRDGKALDVFRPGRHTISTNNVPLLAGLIGLPFGGDSPFRAEVYFVSVREFTDMKWGSQQPLVYRDSELGMVRLRAYGTYSMKVADPQLFVNEVVGTRGSYRTAAIEDYLRSVILNEFNDMLGDVHTSILDIQRMTREIADASRAALADDFTRLGLDLVSFQISAITPPEEVQQRIDERSSMGAIGDMGAYTQYKTAQAIGDAARNEGGSGDATSTGVGLGAGLGIGQAMAGAIGSSYQQSQQRQQQGQQLETRQCPNCNSTIPASAKFCPECGVNLAAKVCPECGTSNSPGAQFCTNCGTKL